MALAHTAFENRQLVDLAIVAARLFLKGSSCIVVGKKIKQLHWKAVV